MKSREMFLEAVGQYYHEQGRHDLPWRVAEADGSFNPYKILVSEVMLQQTQVSRVIPKFLAFIKQFPDSKALAAAPLGQVLVAWQGLGYNRRAKYLRQAAQMVAKDYGGALSANQPMLERLPGVGRNTAGAVMAYAFNQPALFVETNIRTVYIHHFFHDQADVSDKAILELLEQTLDRSNPRVFYWSLMDYGSCLKETVGNLSRASRSYAKQSKFDGSLRQIRGQILRLLAKGPKSKSGLLQTVTDDRAEAVLDVLDREGLIQRVGQCYRLP